MKGQKTVVVIRFEGPRGGPGMPGISVTLFHLTSRNVEAYIRTDWRRPRS